MNVLQQKSINNRALGQHPPRVCPNFGVSWSSLASLLTDRIGRDAVVQVQEGSR